MSSPDQPESVGNPVSLKRARDPLPDAEIESLQPPTKRQKTGLETESVPLATLAAPVAVAHPIETSVDAPAPSEVAKEVAAEPVAPAAVVADPSAVDGSLEELDEEDELKGVTKESLLSELESLYHRTRRILQPEIARRAYKAFPRRRFTVYRTVSKPPEISALSLPLQDAYDILVAMRGHAYAWPFTAPVDWKKLNLDSYPEIVRNPMDFGTIEKKLGRGEYATLQDFEKDVRQVFYNCHLYNTPPTFSVLFFADFLNHEFDENFPRVVRHHKEAEAAGLAPSPTFPLPPGKAKRPKRRAPPAAAAARPPTSSSRGRPQPVASRPAPAQRPAAQSANPASLPSPTPAAAVAAASAVAPAPAAAPVAGATMSQAQKMQLQQDIQWVLGRFGADTNVVTQILKIVEESEGRPAPDEINLEELNDGTLHQLAEFVLGMKRRAADDANLSDSESDSESDSD